MSGKLYTANELAEQLNIPVRTIYNHAKKDGWPVYRVGRVVRFDLEEILALLRGEEQLSLPRRLTGVST